MSPIAIKNLMNLRKVITLFNQAGNKSRDRKQVKDLAMDYLLKDLTTNPSLPIPERYCEMGLWKQIMQVNQHVWRLMESLEEQDVGSNDCEKTENSAEKPKKSFRDFYMEMITSNFSDDLDKLRKDPSLDHKKVSILIDCLETGKDIWSDVEKELLQSLEN
ncbi:uncharacterized protein LOC116291229 [Actinia tenebrosa]|uniref:Ribosome assembly protein 3 n=1 Tax=Actinia tenebrosa TaxID=6105 RepID=A0A6P8HNH6_ACTTE|nr:uncharacterized protein LOC116291229 [Actinia tenebrosa]